ncbi:hypothetical protein ACFSTC_05090 [Nonomuraea ferruginea]
MEPARAGLEGHRDDGVGVVGDLDVVRLDGDGAQLAVAVPAELLVHALGDEGGQLAGPAHGVFRAEIQVDAGELGGERHGLVVGKTAAHLRRLIRSGGVLPGKPLEWGTDPIYHDYYDKRPQDYAARPDEPPPAATRPTAAPRPARRRRVVSGVGVC